MPRFPHLLDELQSGQKVLSRVPIKIIINEKDLFLLSHSEELIANVVQAVVLVSSPFSCQGTEGATEVAIAASFDIANPADPVSQVLPWEHLLGYKGLPE